MYAETKEILDMLSYIPAFVRKQSCLTQTENEESLDAGFFQLQG